ncbi:extensin family protein [Methylobacterium sp. J-088]|uniref:extensin-like domain-containing protein n=1 Tax=Methylobacterium sp. J-088 TaxID=2836664 RepID=UPI001FB9ED46|nr:extensin family protein [Methylobacterium sp. J-088]MCJ2064509.1 extensin family protein [Methylobacterium sp. J-088]
MPGRHPPIRRLPTTLAFGALVLAVSAVASPAAESPAATVPVPPPLPPERPEILKTPPAPEAPPPTPPARPAELTPPASPSKETADAPAQAKPSETGKPEIPVPPPTPPGRPPELSGEAALALKVTPPDDTACRTRLKRLGVEFEPLPPIIEGQCTAPLPLKVVRLADGVALPQGATLTCRTAEALARWVTEVQVEAERSLKHGLTGLELGGSYVCRGQNHDVDAKLSEHAFANAADIMAFTFAGRASIPVKAMPDGSDEARFLSAVREKACGFFRTVLGPGSNAAHANHFHLDERERTAGHRLCE